jgi:hypothetical protein
MAVKTVLVMSSLLALAFAAPQAFAGNAAPNIAEASPQQISPPTDGASSGAPSAQPAKQRQHRHHAGKHRRQPQQQGGNPQQGSSAPNPN